MPTNEPRGGVLLLHGISRTRASMRRLEQTLQRAGYATLNLTYASRRQDLAALAESIHGAVQRFCAETPGPLHIVTHSMGGLLARVYVAQHRPARLGRVVMLAPPNQGSEIADRLADNWLYRAYFGPAGSQLVSQRSEELAALLGRVDYPLGVLAGTRSLYPLASRLLPRPNDGRVSVAATWVDGLTDHLVLPVSHPLIPSNDEAITQTTEFLRHGRFTHPEATSIAACQRVAP